MTRLSRFLCLALVLAAVSPASLLASDALTILIGTPQGATTSIDQTFRIIASFSEPMTALTTAPDNEGSGPFTLEPRVKGVYRWLGTTTVAFIPADTLPFATRFTVTIPQGTRSSSGAALAHAFAWTFETPRPIVVRMSPSPGEHHIEPDRAIVMTLNQPVDLATIGQWISLEETAAGTRTYPAYTLRAPTAEDVARSIHVFDAEHPTPKERERIARERERTIVIVPRAPFHRGSTVRVVCKSGLRAKEGPLGMAQEFSGTFTIYGELKFAGVSSDNNFHPAYSLRIALTNPVSFAELTRHITLTPAARVTESYDEDYTTDVHYIAFDLKPETDYTGVVTAGVKDQFGNMLERDAPFSFRTSAYPPSVSMTTGPGLIEAYEQHKIPVVFLNCDSVGLSMGRLGSEQIVPMAASTDFWSNDGWSAAQQRRMAKSDRVDRIWRLPNMPRNKSVVKPIDLDEVLGGTKRKGVAYVQVKQFDREAPRIFKTIVQVTDLGVTAKFSPQSILIWVTRLTDASHVGGAEIELRTDSNRVVWRGNTGHDGSVRAPGWGALGLEPKREYYGQNEEYESSRPPRLWVVVKLGEDLAFTSSQWNEGIEPYAFNIEADWNPQPQKYEAVVFTDRGLYKANETVNMKGIVRVMDTSAWTIPKTMRARVRISDPRSEEILKRDVKPNAYGSFTLTLPVKPSAPTGYYRVNVEVRSGTRGKKERWTQIGSGEFRVEAFRVAEFEVRSRLERDTYTIGDTARGFVSAQYLFGAPLKDARVQWRYSIARTEFIPKGFETFSFGTIDWLSQYEGVSASRRVIASGEGVLDGSGSITVSSMLSKNEITGTVSLTLEGDATSVSRQTLSGRSSVLVHGGAYYVGVKPSTTFLAVDSALGIALATVTPEGVVVDNSTVVMKVFRRMWLSVRKAETGGRYAWQTEVVDSLADSTIVTTGRAVSVHRFVPSQPGLYYISARSTDSRGNEIETQSTFYVSGAGYVPWARSDDDRIELVADRAHYAPGDTAIVLVKNPYERAQALISVEREGILSHSTRMLEGSAPRIVIPIEQAYLPNVFVSVVLLQGRTEKPAGSVEADLGRPSFKAGYVKLSVAPDEKQLSVHVETDKAEYRPGDTVEARLRVRTHQGAGVKSEVAVSVADQGVLNLIGYRLPDPFDTFYRERGLGVVTTETRLHLVKQRNYGEKGEDAGGGGASMKAAAELDAEGIRKDFRASAYWNPMLLTDDIGRATVRFKLPDNITSFKLMATAQTLQSDFGEGSSTFGVTKPVLLQPSLPRLARAGDRFEAGVVIVNYSSAHRKISLTSTASGIGFQAPDSTVIELAPGQAREVRYRFTAERTGTAVVTIKAKSQGDEDGLRWSFPIVAPRVKETTALFNSSIEARREERVFIPESVFPNEGEVEVTASSTALVGLSGGMSYLFTYPYGCLEQKVSSVLPIILAKDVVDAFKFEIFRHADARAVAKKTIDELALFQKFNGGFSYWKGDEAINPYVSAYAVLTLLEAKAAGYRVDARSLENGVQYLSRILSGEEPSTGYSIEASQCTRALIVYTLARAGRIDHGTIDKLYAERATLPLFAKAYVLRAATIADGASPIVAELARDFLNRAKIDPTGASFEEPSETGLAWIFHSNTRTTAVILQALIEANKEGDVGAKIVRRLLNSQRNGHWRTTQENLFVVGALAAYFKKYEHEDPNFRAQIALDGRRMLDEAFKGRTLETKRGREPIANLEKGKDLRVTLEKNGAGRLYYGVRLTYAPCGESASRSEGLTVLRSMEPADGSGATEIRAGMLLKVTVSVIAHQDRQFVAIEDPVPAGCEIVAVNFATSASNLADDEGGESSGVFNHTERYDDRLAIFADRMPAGMHSYTYLVRAIHPGSFVAPSARAECMYEPEIFARTQSGIVVIH